jgi:hypothetical protein
MHSLKLSLSLLSSLLVSCLVARASVDSTVTRDTVTPLGALWRSAVLPGWGQLYYGSIPKAVLFAGASIAVGSVVVWNNARYADWRYQQYDSTDGRKTAALREREFYRDQRDVAALWLLAIYAFNLMDAYVGGEMSRFPIGPNAHVQLIPIAGGLGIAVHCALPRLIHLP